MEDIGKALRAARARKGLSQRALSALSGVAQYQISKVENGVIDLRLSSLIELARALELELTLVPRKSIAAVQSIVRSRAPEPVPRSVLKEIDRTLDAVRSISALYPGLSDLTVLKTCAHAFKTLPGIDRELDSLRAIGKPVRALQKLIPLVRRPPEATTLSGKQRRTLREAADAARHLRSRLAHRARKDPPHPRPAYSLDEEEDG